MTWILWALFGGLGLAGLYCAIMLYRNETVYHARMRFIDSPEFLWKREGFQHNSYNKQLYDFTTWTEQGFLNQLRNS